jgi:hypothetical protein
VRALRSEIVATRKRASVYSHAFPSRARDPGELDGHGKGRRTGAEVPSPGHLGHRSTCASACSQSFPACERSLLFTGVPVLHFAQQRLRCKLTSC